MRIGGAIVYVKLVSKLHIYIIHNNYHTIEKK